MKLTSLEEKFVNVLTSAVWWFEVRWNKGAVFVSFLLVFCIPALISFFLMVFTMDSIIAERTVLSFFILFVIVPILVGISVSILVVMALLFAWSDEKINVLKNTKISPNPNKANVWIWECRIIVFSQFIATFFVPQAALIVGPLIISALYVLCVDPIPPAEKEKQRKQNELKKTNLKTDPVHG